MPRISFFRPPLDQRLQPLLPSVKRHYVKTPLGDLELLVAEPANPPANEPRKTPIFFAHGGCGSAGVWLEYMDYFSQQHNIPCYAVSYRGRGASWYPSFLRLFFTSKFSLAGDLVAGLREAAQLEKSKRGLTGSERIEFVLAGHSSGGGLSQLVLSEGMELGDAAVKGLVLLGAIPNFGNSEVNNNWLKMDPWFMPRMLFLHFWHPMSPLSSTKLVAQAFFCKSYPLAKVVEFEKRMPRYESLAWPMGMGKRFVDCTAVLKRIVWANQPGRDKLLVLAAGEDRLVSPDLAERTAADYRAAAAEMKGGTKDGRNGVRYDVVPGAGHHLQNDLQWKEGADKILAFYDQA